MNYNTHTGQQKLETTVILYTHTIDKKKIKNYLIFGLNL